jgi:CBS-domain-containing membrane protein
MMMKGRLLDRAIRRDMLRDQPWQVGHATTDRYWRAAQVVDVMSWAPVTVSPDATATYAESVATQKGFTHLPVRDGAHLVGVLCTCDLREAGVRTTVGERMSVPIVLTDERETLESAAVLMQAQGVGCLPVVVGGRIFGLLTRGDLRRVGFHFAGHECLSCGSRHHVRGRFCLECLDHVAPTPFPELYADIGGGD